eukprot:ctg_1163.g417
MIDEGEMDWKVIVIDVRDPSAAGLNDVEDLYRAMPGLVHATFSWFRTYKVPDGKDENKFAFRERIQSRQYAVEIVNECHQSWKKLVAGKVKHSNHHCSNTTLSDTPLYMPAAAANRLVEEARASMRCSRGPATAKSDPAGGDGNTPVSIGGTSYARKGGGGRLPRNLSIGQLETLALPKFAQAPTSARHGGERVSATETIKRFLTEQQRHYPHGSSDLSLLITEIGTAAKIIAARIRDEPNGPMESLQHTAEMQLHAALAASGFCCMIYSSQSQRMMPLDPAAGIGNYVVVYTALLGQVGGSMGSIFSVYYRKSYSGREGDTADLLQRTGYEQVAAGYALYTSAVRLMLSTEVCADSATRVSLLAGHPRARQGHRRRARVRGRRGDRCTGCQTFPLRGEHRRQRAQGVSPRRHSADAGTAQGGAGGLPRRGRAARVHGAAGGWQGERGQTTAAGAERLVAGDAGAAFYRQHRRRERSGGEGAGSRGARALAHCAARRNDVCVRETRESKSCRVVGLRRRRRRRHPYEASTSQHAVG